MREGDLCARLGGDEFAVLLDGRSDAETVAERIVRALEGCFEVEGHEVFVGVSVGIASGRQPAETLLRNADVAMYQAKRAGAGRYARFEPRMHAALVSRLGLEAAGCDVGQGFLLGRLADAPAISRLLSVAQPK